MPVVVRAVNQGEYQQWINQRKAAAPSTGAAPAAAPQTPAQSAGEATTPSTAAAQTQTPTPAGAAAAPAGEMTALMQKGEQVYKTHCVACHQAEGQGTPPAFPPLKGSKITTGDVKDHLAIVIKGKPGTAMAAFGNQLKDDELAAVITYERNALGNNVGDVVQPADVQAAR
jgi:cytochrome c oxidase subunit 2